MLQRVMVLPRAGRVVAALGSAVRDAARPACAPLRVMAPLARPHTIPTTCRLHISAARLLHASAAKKKTGGGKDDDGWTPADRPAFKPESDDPDDMNIFTEGTDSLLRPGGKISYEEAVKLPLEVYEYPHSVLLAASMAGDYEAREEVLRRHIMVVDHCEWDVANERLQEIKDLNRANMLFYQFPYKLGIWSALTAGFVSIPLIFHLDCVMWFNDAFVTFEEAGEGELDTWLEVGSWAWNWMEPPLGEASFFILCMQMTRNMMQNLGWKPYGDWVKKSRADLLIKQWPQYSHRALIEFAEVHCFSADTAGHF